MSTIASTVSPCLAACTPCVGCRRLWHPSLRPGSSYVDGVTTVSTQPCGSAPREMTAGLTHPTLRPVAASGVTRHGLSCDRTIGGLSRYFVAALRQRRRRDIGLNSIRSTLAGRCCQSQTVDQCSKLIGPSTARPHAPRRVASKGSRSTTPCARITLGNR